MYVSRKILFKTEIVSSYEDNLTKQSFYLFLMTLKVKV